MEKNIDSDYSSVTADPSLKEIKITINSYIVLEIEIKKNFSELPFFCFQDENVSSIEELNFKQLKKCKLNEKNKYMVIFLGQFENTNRTHTTLNKNFNTWHNKNPQVKFQLTETSDSYIELYGNMLKIFRPQYKPTTSE